MTCETISEAAAALETEPERFMLEHAGYSYDPKRETAAEGQLRCARELAAAERERIDERASVAWEIDPDITSHDWEPRTEPERSTWLATLYTADGRAVENLGGIDLAGEPYSDPYCRVVAAELWSEFSARRASMIELGEN